MVKIRKDKIESGKKPKYMVKWRGSPSIKTMTGPSGKSYVLDSQVFVEVQEVDAIEFKTCSGFEVIKK